MCSIHMKSFSHPSLNAMEINVLLFRPEFSMVSIIPNYIMLLSCICVIYLFNTASHMHHYLVPYRCWKTKP
jgi:hypothetical protein